MDESVCRACGRSASEATKSCVQVELTVEQVEEWIPSAAAVDLEWLFRCHGPERRRMRSTAENCVRIAFCRRRKTNHICLIRTRRRTSSRDGQEVRWRSFGVCTVSLSKLPAGKDEGEKKYTISIVWRVGGPKIQLGGFQRC